MIATRRPGLVDLTLRSFHRNLLSQLDCPRVFLNIDPLWGMDKDDVAVEDICRRYFRTVEVRRPVTPSFGGAVKWAWSRPDTDWFLHLEDDWLLGRRIQRARLESELGRVDVGQVQLANLAPSLRRRKTPLAINSSPSFLRREFAQIAVKHMDPEMDPEKQFYEGFNPGLAELVQFRTKFYGDSTTPRLLHDTGRIWRNVHGIKKGLRRGTSLWETSRRPKSSLGLLAQRLAMELRLSLSDWLPSA